MFRLTHPLPSKYWVAISGGIDSAAVFRWLNQPSRRDNMLGVVYVNHGTKYGERVEWLLNVFYEKKYKVPVLRFRVEGEPPKGESKEKWWRDQRYSFFEQVPGDDPIILAHHLDDCLEEMIMCNFVRGYNATIPYRNGRCIRPFRLWKKKDIRGYIARSNEELGPAPFFEDPSNKDTNHKRNFIRHEIVPAMLKLNPGVYKIVERLIGETDEREDYTG